jgi:hypothetical protein
LKRWTSKKHRCTFVAKVRIQSHFIKNHIKWQKSLNLSLSYFLIEGIPTIETKDTFRIWMHLIFFLAIEISFYELPILMVCTTYSLPHPLAQKTLSMYIANKIAKQFKPWHRTTCIRKIPLVHSLLIVKHNVDVASQTHV